MKKIIVILLFVFVATFLAITKINLEATKETEELTEITENDVFLEMESTTIETTEETTIETTEEITIETTQELKAEDFIHLNKNKTFNNRYFFKKNVKELKGKMTYEDSHNHKDGEADVNLYIENLGSLENGTLYRLKFRTDELTEEYLYNYSDFAAERLTIFNYVTSDKIYHVYATQEEIANMTNEKELLEKSVVICQANELKDSLAENEMGYHHYIKIDKNVVEMLRYSDNGNGDSVGYFEHDRFEKDKGLIFYRSGYRLSSGLIIITFGDD